MPPTRYRVLCSTSTGKPEIDLTVEAASHDAAFDVAEQMLETDHGWTRFDFENQLLRITMTIEENGKSTTIPMPRRPPLPVCVPGRRKFLDRASAERPGQESFLGYSPEPCRRRADRPSAELHIEGPGRTMFFPASCRNMPPEQANRLGLGIESGAFAVRPADLAHGLGRSVAFVGNGTGVLP